MTYVTTQNTCQGSNRNNKSRKPSTTEDLHSKVIMKSVQEGPMSEDDAHDASTLVRENDGESYQRLDFLRDVAIQQLAMFNHQIPRPSIHNEPKIPPFRQHNTSKSIHQRTDSYTLDYPSLNNMHQRVSVTGSQGMNYAPQKTSSKSSGAVVGETHTYLALPEKPEPSESSCGKRTRPVVTSDSTPTSLRKGKWTREEEDYANAIIKYHECGLLHMPYGESLRSYLSKRLSCDGMRITKKFANTTNLAQRSYSFIGRDISHSDLENARNDLTRLEQRFRRRILSSNDHDQISESGSSIANSISASEQPVQNSFASAAQSSSIDYGSFSKSMGLINPLLATILLQQLLSSNASMNASDSGSLNQGRDIKLKANDLLPSTSSGLNQQAQTAMSGAASLLVPSTSWQSPFPPSHLPNDFHEQNKSKSSLSVNHVEAFNANNFSGVAPSIGGQINAYQPQNPPFQAHQIHKSNGSKEIVELKHSTNVQFLEKAQCQREDSTAFNERKQEPKEATDAKSIIIHQNDGPFQKNKSSAVLNWIPNAGQHQPSGSKKGLRKKDLHMVTGLETIVMNDDMVPTDEKNDSRCFNDGNAPTEKGHSKSSKENKVRTSENEIHVMNIGLSEPCSDERNVGKNCESLASQRLMGFLSELRKNHEAAMSMSFGVEQTSAAITAHLGTKAASPTCFKEDQRTGTIPVRSVSQTFSSNANSNHDHSSVSTFEQSVIPNMMWNGNLKFPRVRDFDVASSISGDTGSSSGQGKIESIAGVMNDAHETESNSSSECHISSNDGAYTGSCNTSGNSTSDDELGSIPTAKDRLEYMTASFSGPLRKRLKQVKESLD